MRTDSDYYTYPVRPRRRSAAMALAGSLTFALIAGGTLTAGSLYFAGAASSQASAAEDEQSFYSALTNYKTDEAAASSAISTAAASISAAERVLAESEGKTLDNTARDALDAEVTTAKTDLEEAEAELAVWQAVRLRTVSGVYNFEQSTKLLIALSPIALSPIALSISIDDEVDSVDAAVSAWEAEQARLAAEKAAAEAAAAKAAEQTSNASSPKKPSSPSTPAPAGIYTKNVWTAGYQAEIDRCLGAVDLTVRYDLAVIAEHNHCGGSSFPTSAGTKVKLTGLRAGTYEVVGVVANLNRLVDGSSKIPRGYDLLFQTCNGDLISFIALKKVG